jgi:hypothetical protein
MKIKVTFLVLVIIGVVVLGGCQKTGSAQEGASSSAGASAQSGDTGAAQGDLGNLDRLVLGTLKLEGGENAATPEQAAKLLPLWQLIQSGTLKSQAETDAVLKQIEGQMTEAQLAAIDAMGLTTEDMQAWRQEQGIEMPTPSDRQGTPEAFQNMSEEERTQMRERFQNMTPEERATAMAEMGFQPPAGAAGGQAPGRGQDPGGMRGGNFLLNPLIALLTERAAQ